jgi:hypothetical protein
VGVNTSGLPGKALHWSVEDIAVLPGLHPLRHCAHRLSSVLHHLFTGPCFFQFSPSYRKLYPYIFHLMFADRPKNGSSDNAAADGLSFASRRKQPKANLAAIWHRLSTTPVPEMFTDKALCRKQFGDGRQWLRRATRNVGAVCCQQDINKRAWLTASNYQRTFTMFKVLSSIIAPNKGFVFDDLVSDRHHLPE